MLHSRKNGWSLSAGLLCLLLITVPVLAAKGQHKAANPNNGQGKVTAVSATSITVQPKNGAAKTYTITGTTVIKLNGKTVQATDLSTKDHAKIKSGDGTTATKITARSHHKKAKPAAA
jgi:hypothetical protein